jgi:hypothetical protein
MRIAVAVPVISQSSASWFSNAACGTAGRSYSGSSFDEATAPQIGTNDRIYFYGHHWWLDGVVDLSFRSQGHDLGQVGVVPPERAVEGLLATRPAGKAGCRCGRPPAPHLRSGR